MKALYRIINALLAALAFPAALFLEFIFFQASTSLADYGLEESITIKRIIDIFSGKDRLSQFVLDKAGTFRWPEAFAPINGKLVAFAVFFALVLATALFIIIFSCCSNKRIPVLLAGVLGLIFSIVMTVCFNSAAKPILNGEINIVSALAGNGLIVSILGGLVNVDTLRLGGFQNGFIIIMICIILWTLAFYVVEIGDNEKNKK